MCTEFIIDHKLFAMGAAPARPAAAGVRPAPGPGHLVWLQGSDAPIALSVAKGRQPLPLPQRLAHQSFPFVQPGYGPASSPGLKVEYEFSQDQQLVLYVDPAAPNDMHVAAAAEAQMEKAHTDKGSQLDAALRSNRAAYAQAKRDNAAVSEIGALALEFDHLNEAKEAHSKSRWYDPLSIAVKLTTKWRVVTLSPNTAAVIDGLGVVMWIPQRPAGNVVGEATFTLVRQQAQPRSRPSADVAMQLTLSADEVRQAAGRGQLHGQRMYVSPSQ